MEVRNFVTFGANFSQEYREMDGEEVPPGRDLALSIMKGLRRCKVPCSDLDQHDSYGWCFDVSVSNAKVSCMVQLSDEWLMIIEPVVSLFGRIFKKETGSDSLRLVCEQVNKVLRGDERFHRVRWYTRKELEGQSEGYESP